MKHKIKLEVCELEKKNYHLFVTLKIGDAKARLLIDTGASKTVFDSERVLQFVSAKKIKSHESKSVGLGVTEMETHVVKLKNISFGKFLVDKFDVAILPIGHVNEIYQMLDLQPIDGVLGSDFFMKYNACICYADAVLKFSLPK